MERPDPTKQEIYDRCQAIQRDWTPAERLKRTGRVCREYYGVEIKIVAVPFELVTAAMYDD